ncbi:MAG: radical SAM protein [Myxococcota bacterium]|nr:radical SAM protein [Myxococcota bacterium]
MPLLDVILGYDCNLWCDYCTISPPMRARALSTPAVLAAMREGRADGFDAVSFTGGEPTIRPDLLGLVRAARRLGYVDVKVQTNGLLLAHRSNLDRLLDAGLTRLHLSIHTHRADRYDAKVRRPGSHPLMVKALEQAAAVPSLAFVADVIIDEDTYRDLPDAIDWLAARSVREAHLWYVSLTDGNRDNLRSLPRMTDAMPYLREAFARADRAGMSVRSLHVPRCLLGDEHRRAWDPGAQGVRVVSPEATFDLSASRLAGRVHVAACEGCPHRGICPGLRVDYLERFGDAEVAAVGGAAPRGRPPVVD